MSITRVHSSLLSKGHRVINVVVLIVINVVVFVLIGVVFVLIGLLVFIFIGVLVFVSIGICALIAIALIGYGCYHTVHRFGYYHTVRGFGSTIFRHHSNSIVVVLDNPLLCSVVFQALASEGTDGMEDLHRCTWDWLASGGKGIDSLDGLLLLEAFPRGIGLGLLIEFRDTGFKPIFGGLGKFLVIPASNLF